MNSGHYHRASVGATSEASSSERARLVFLRIFAIIVILFTALISLSVNLDAGAKSGTVPIVGWFPHVLTIFALSVLVVSVEWD